MLRERRWRFGTTARWLLSPVLPLVWPRAVDLLATGVGLASKTFDQLYDDLRGSRESRDRALVFLLAALVWSAVLLACSYRGDYFSDHNRAAALRGLSCVLMFSGVCCVWGLIVFGFATTWLSLSLGILSLPFLLPIFMSQPEHDRRYGILLAPLLGGHLGCMVALSITGQLARYEYSAIFQRMGWKRWVLLAAAIVGLHVGMAVAAIFWEQARAADSDVLRTLVATVLASPSLIMVWLYRAGTQWRWTMALGMVVTLAYATAALGGSIGEGEKVSARVPGYGTFMGISVGVVYNTIIGFGYLLTCRLFAGSRSRTYAWLVMAVIALGVLEAVRRRWIFENAAAGLQKQLPNFAIAVMIPIIVMALAAYVCARTAKRGSSDEGGDAGSQSTEK